ncbi:MAG: hypothetical protein RR310_07265 [Eubacterium sp.]
MKAVKANKVYTIGETQKETYLKDGFDVYGNDGELVEYGHGKTIPYEMYKEVLDELNRLKEKTEEVPIMDVEPQKKQTRAKA